MTTLNISPALSFKLCVKASAILSVSGLLAYGLVTFFPAEPATAAERSPAALDWETQTDHPPEQCLRMGPGTHPVDGFAGTGYALSCRQISDSLWAWSIGRREEFRATSQPATLPEYGVYACGQGLVYSNNDNACLPAAEDDAKYECRADRDPPCRVSRP